MVDRGDGLTGHNHLGRLLMELRAEIRAGQSAPVTLVAFDLEATCWDRPISAGKGIPPHEIIEIGAVAWTGPEDASRAECQAFIRPVEHPVLSDFCVELTTITQAEVDDAQPLATVLSEFIRWCERFGEYRLVSWGQWDMNQIREECTRKSIPLALLEARHVNLKEVFSLHRGPRRQVGLGAAAALMGFEPSQPQHRGIADARTIVGVLDRGFGELLRSRL